VRREQGPCAGPHTRVVACLSIFSLFVTACAPVGPNFSRPVSKLQSDWIDVPAPKRQPSEVNSEIYWAAFHDETLVRLIRKGDKQSPTLLSAVELMTQAQQQVRIDVGNLLPVVQLSGGSNYGLPTIASQLTGTTAGATTDQLLGQLSWEIDFWGQLRRQLQSDKASLKGAQAGLAAARVSLEASVASAYCNVRMTERRIEVAETNLVQQAEEKRIAEAKYRLGATSELDFRQAETQYEQTKSQLPVLRQSLAQFQHSLSVLVGETPDYFVSHEPAGTGLPTVPKILPIGAPRDLLRRRPDVLQAEYNAAAQSARIGVAQAALYPTFSLTGEFGYSTTASANNLFRWDNRAVQYGIGFTFPIFDRGKLTSQVRIEDSLFRQAVLTYQNQVLTAQQDVEDGLASIVGQTGQVNELRLANSAAARAVALAMLQYRAGQVDYTTVSTAEQNRAQSSDSLVQAQGGVLQAYISVFRAIGGGWDPNNPRIRDQGAQQ
jgi:NodT family efflux transporter outer membrane factor (OMF) lipoprotein